MNNLVPATGSTTVAIPSAARDATDMDVAVASLTVGGYQMLRPQPRGAAVSSLRADTP